MISPSKQENPQDRRRQEREEGLLEQELGKQGEGIEEGKGEVKINIEGGEKSENREGVECRIREVEEVKIEGRGEIKVEKEGITDDKEEGTEAEIKGKEEGTEVEIKTKEEGAQVEIKRNEEGTVGIKKKEEKESFRDTSFPSFKEEGNSIFENKLKKKTEIEEAKIFQATNPFPRSLKVKELCNSLADKYRANVAIVTPCEEKFKVEEVEDVRSIWISDEEEEMSRRPQVLKIIDNDLTRRCNKNFDKNDSLNNSKELIGTKGSIETARNFFEKKNTEKEIFKNPPIEGRFERIVKETSNIFGKACNVVKGTLGFEARSESSDLGLGSEIGSDTRRQSVDDSKNESKNNETRERKLIPQEESKERDENSSKEEVKKNHTNLTRSRSCVDSLECQDEPEFDHVRYKIVKSNLFGKSIFSTSKGDVTYEGLMEYLREYSFQELLLDNNVVIIEPVRAEVERKPSMNVKSKSLPTCRVSGATQKNREAGVERKNFDEKSRTCPRQSSLRKHFFYHPIRINKELIDDELPNPDTVKNVTKMFEETFRAKKNLERDKSRRSLSMKDLSLKDVKDEEGDFYDGVEKVRESR